MKRLQIMIDEDVDAELERQAAREATSKAALIRRYVALGLRPATSVEDDSLWDMVGLVEGIRDDSRSVDDVVYPPQ
jgi:hypothetical protein